MDCIFCKIIKGEIPSNKIYENQNTYAFLDINPVNHGHTLVIPKKHYINIFDTPEETLKQLILTIKKITPAIKKAVNAVFDEYKDQVYTYTRELVKQLKKDGYLLFAISGSQIEIVSKIAKHYGFDDCVGTIYEHEGDKFTGAMTAHLGGKHVVLRELIDKHHADTAGSIAVGDAASDISMLEMVETPIAFNPERNLFEHAKTKGWKIVIERKNIVYELKKQDGRYVLAKTD